MYLLSQNTTSFKQSLLLAVTGKIWIWCYPKDEVVQIQHKMAHKGPDSEPGSGCFVFFLVSNKQILSSEDSSLWDQSFGSTKPSLCYLFPSPSIGIRNNLCSKDMQMADVASMHNWALLDMSTCAMMSLIAP